MLEFEAAIDLTVRVTATRFSEASLHLQKIEVLGANCEAVDVTPHWPDGDPDNEWWLDPGAIAIGATGTFATVLPDMPVFVSFQITGTGEYTYEQDEPGLPYFNEGYDVDIEDFQVFLKVSPKLLINISVCVSDAQHERLVAPHIDAFISCRER